jgi:hypothetical protein
LPWQWTGTHQRTTSMYIYIPPDLIGVALILLGMSMGHRDSQNGCGPIVFGFLVLIPLGILTILLW